MKKLLLITFIFSTYTFGMEKDEPVLLAELPTDIKLEIIQRLNTSNTPEQAGQALRNLQSISKKWYTFSENHTEYLITQIAKKFTIHKLLAALYLGTKAAKDWFEETVHTTPEKEILASLGQALDRFTGSKQSKAIIQILELYSNLHKKLDNSKPLDYLVYSKPFGKKSLGPLRLADGTRICPVLRAQEKDIFITVYKPNLTGPLHIDTGIRNIGIYSSNFTKDNNIIFWGITLDRKLFAALVTTEGKVLAQYGLEEPKNEQSANSLWRKFLNLFKYN